MKPSEPPQSQGYMDCQCKATTKHSSSMQALLRARWRTSLTHGASQQQMATDFLATYSVTTITTNSPASPPTQSLRNPHCTTHPSTTGHPHMNVNARRRIGTSSAPRGSSGKVSSEGSLITYMTPLTNSTIPSWSIPSWHTAMSLHSRSCNIWTIAITPLTSKQRKHWKTRTTTSGMATNISPSSGSAYSRT